MSDAILMLRERVTKAEAKVQRHEKALESARSELADLHTTLRVMADITGESTPISSPVGPRQLDILMLLGTGAAKAYSPAELLEAYKLVSDEGITADTFRTTIWRMKDREFRVDTERFVVRGEEGRYWKDLILDGANAAAPGTQAPRAANSSGLATGRGTGFPSTPPGGSIPPSSTSIQASDFDADLDDDVPF